MVNNSVQEDVFSFDECFEPANVAAAKAKTLKLLEQFNISTDEAIEEMQNEMPDQKPE